MSSASNVKPVLAAVPASNVSPSESLPAPKAGAPAETKPWFPRVNAGVDAVLRVLSFVGLGFLKPIVAMTRGEDPRAHLRQLWLDLGAPVLAIAAFLFIWSQVSSGIQTSLGQIPGPTAVWTQAKALWADHADQREKAAAFYERQEKRNAEKLAEDPNAEIRQVRYTGKPSYIDQIFTSL